MDIKCKTNPYYFLTPSQMETTHFRGVQNASKAFEKTGARVLTETKNVINAGLCEDILVKSPVASKNATGLFSLMIKCKDIILNYIKNYKNNIKHTFDHKVVFALIERQLFGKISIDSFTHDLDKLILYVLGCPKSFVSKFHRQISVHHTESHKKNNLRSMLCDNIASSPEFKPEKKKSLREHYFSNEALQAVPGFGEMLEKYNYGENLNFDSIKASKKDLFKLTIPVHVAAIIKSLYCIFS